MSKKVRIGNDIDVTWNVDLTKPDGSRIDLSSMELNVQLIVGSKEFDITEDNAGLTITGDVITFTFFGSRQRYTGSYVLKLSDANNTSITYDVRNAFILVDHSWESIDVISQPTSVEVGTAISISRALITSGPRGPKGDKGDPGDIGSVLTIGANGNWFINGIDTGIAAGGIEGPAGSFKSMVFKRAVTQPATPTGGTYENPIPVGWYDSIPEGTEMIWASTATFYGDGSHSDWSVPVEMKDTNKVDYEFALKQDNDATPAMPTDENRHGGSGQQIWYDPSLDASAVDFKNMYWMAMRELNGTTWTAWTIMRIKGEKGETGDGESSFKSIIFVRMNSTPAKPTSSDGSWSNPSPSVLAGQNSAGEDVYWSDGIPSGNNVIWACSRIFTKSGASPQEAAWSDPRRMSDIRGVYDVEFAKKQDNDNIPALPTDANRHGGTGTQIWFDPELDSSEDFTKMFWRAEREYENGVPKSWVITRIQGEKGEKGDTGRHITDISTWYKVHTSDSGIVSPAVTINPTTEGWSKTVPELTETNPYLWCFVRYTFNEGSPQQSAASVIRYLSADIVIDYTEITGEVVNAINADLSEGSIVYRINSLEQTAATSTDIDGAISSARTEWQSDIEDGTNAAIISSVSKGQMYWSDTNGTMYDYDHFRQSGEDLDSAYETRVTNLGYTLNAVISEMSAIRQQSDNILLAVGDGQGNVAAAIKILKDAQTSGTPGVDGKIILDASNVEVTSTLSAGIVNTGFANVSSQVLVGKINDATGQIDGTVITDSSITTQQIDVDNLYVKHLQGADGDFSGEITATSGNISGNLEIGSSGSIYSSNTTGSFWRTNTVLIDADHIECKSKNSASASISYTSEITGSHIEVSNQYGNKTVLSDNTVTHEYQGNTEYALFANGNYKLSIESQLPSSPDSGMIYIVTSGTDKGLYVGSTKVV